MTVEMEDLFVVLVFNLIVNCILALTICLYIPSIDKYIRKVSKIIKRYDYEN